MAVVPVRTSILASTPSSARVSALSLVRALADGLLAHSRASSHVPGATSLFAR